MTHEPTTALHSRHLAFMLPAPAPMPQRKPKSHRHAMLLVLLAAALAPAPTARAAVTPEQQALVDGVMRRLLAVVERPEGYDAWPPDWRVIDDNEIGAFSWLDQQERTKVIPIVRIHRGFLEKVAEMNEDRAAFVLGHELAHLIYGHSLNSKGDTGITYAAFGREQEIAADKLGMELALKAGYSYRPALSAARRFIDLDHEYTSFEGVGSDHPSWHDRIALMETDEVQAELWRAMSAFNTGVYFLQSEQHQRAVLCFERVTREFPKCYEAWANLGYARLMMYCDALEPEDLRGFDVGHLVVGGFYDRAGSLAAGVRGISEDLWFQAVEDLQQALKLKDDLVLAKANLALAHLVHPSGSPDVGAAAQQFDEVAALLDDPRASAEIGPLTRASLLANAWIGVAHTDPARSDAVMQQLEVFLRRAEQDGRTAAGVRALRSAIGYTRAFGLANASTETDRRNSLPLFEQYLTVTPPSSSWWPLAYERYEATAKALGETPKTLDELAKRKAHQWRVVSSVITRQGIPVGVADPAPDAIEQLGAADSTAPIADGTKLEMLQYGAHGVDILVGREVVAIVLNRPDSPRIKLRRPGLASETAEIYVGMPRAELEQLLGDDWVSKLAPVFNAKTRHNFYEDVGLAVKFLDGKVAEIIIAQPPHGQADK